MSRGATIPRPGLWVRTLNPSGEPGWGPQGKSAARPPPHLAPQLIYMHWMNTVVNYCGPFEYEVGYCERLKSFLEANLEWMQRQVELNKDSAYWHQVGTAARTCSEGWGRVGLPCRGDLFPPFLACPWRWPSLSPSLKQTCLPSICPVSTRPSFHPPIHLSFLPSIDPST